MFLPTRHFLEPYPPPSTTDYRDALDALRRKIVRGETQLANQKYINLMDERILVVLLKLLGQNALPWINNWTASWAKKIKVAPKNLQVLHDLFRDTYDPTYVIHFLSPKHFVLSFQNHKKVKKGGKA